ADTYQHTTQVQQGLKHWKMHVEAVTITAHLVTMTTGIMETMYATVKDDTSAEKLINLSKESYQNDYFVRIREAATFPSTKEVYGSNFCDIGLTYDERTKRVTDVSVIDNLVKGA